MKQITDGPKVSSFESTENFLQHGVFKSAWKGFLVITATSIFAHYTVGCSTIAVMPSKAFLFALCFLSGVYLATGLSERRLQIKRVATGIALSVLSACWLRYVDSAHIVVWGGGGLLGSGLVLSMQQQRIEEKFNAEKKVT